MGAYEFQFLELWRYHEGTDLTGCRDRTGDCETSHHGICKEHVETEAT